MFDASSPHRDHQRAQRPAPPFSASSQRVAASSPPGAQANGPSRAPAATVLIERIRWLIKLRWIAVAGVVATLAFVHWGLRVALPLPQLSGVMIALAVYNSLLSRVVIRLGVDHSMTGEVDRRLLSRLEARLALLPVFVIIRLLGVANLLRARIGTQSRGALSPLGNRRATLRGLLIPSAVSGLERGWDVFQAAAFASAQVAVDLIALALLLHFTGGIENPFLYFFVFHVILSSMLLSRQATYLQTAFGFLLMAGIAVAEYLGVAPHYPLGDLWPVRDAFREPVFVFAQLAGLGTTLFLAAYMAGNTASLLRSREGQTVLLGRELAANARLLEQAYDRLAAVERAKSQYMRKVAHELRGPLGTIQTALGVVLDGTTGEISPAPRNLIERAERRTSELSQVTVDLLALSRAREGQLAVERTNVDLTAVLAEVTEDARDAAQRAGISLEADVDPSVGAVEGDASSLRQLIGNLVSNAIRYTPAGGHVSIESKGSADSATLVVRDTGIGIPAEDLPHIFEEFFRTTNARRHNSQGTGLGLAIVKAAADQHGASVAVTSELGRGTAFTVTLPRFPPAADARPDDP